MFRTNFAVSQAVATFDGVNNALHKVNSVVVFFATHRDCKVQTIVVLIKAATFLEKSVSLIDD